MEESDVCVDSRFMEYRGMTIMELRKLGNIAVVEGSMYDMILS